MQSSKTADLVSSLDRELHDLAQPISSLQCRLEIAKMLDNEMELRHAVDGSLEDLQRLTQNFRRMRALVVEALKGNV